MDITSIQSGQKFAVSDAQPITVERVKPTADATANTDDKLLQQVPQNTQGMAEQADKVSTEERVQNIELAVQEVEAFLQVQNRNLAFTVDEGTERSVVTVKDSESGDVIRQIPSDEVLQLAERIKDLQEDIGSSVGVLVNNKV
ncbi:flagellar biosynthesis protein FlaG [Salinimonas sediminis]|uniref:Flagellar biosynthesis protein FlaG n=2 Tax=Salinimonas sediminis TaxID=2303538 RepID=A0A346NJK6_9ALTE|nr:flagellar biosynthesis protein FlaG [Salinimonas sediminis]